MQFFRLVCSSFVLMVLWGCQPSADSLTLEESFSAAARSYDVPRDLLVSLAFGASRFDAHQAQREKQHLHSGEVAEGIMGLVREGPGPSFWEAVELTGFDEVDVALDPFANVFGAAALLRDIADDLEHEHGLKIDRIGEWYPVVEAYSGYASELNKGSYARQVYRFIEGGLVFQAPSGEILRIDAQDVFVEDYLTQYIGGSEYYGAQQVISASSSNYSNSSRASGAMDMVVIHTMQGSYSGSISWFQNASAGASAHYMVRSSDGEVTQMVWEEDTAWHAGDWATNARSVGIELEGFVDAPELWYTDIMYRSAAKLTRDIADRRGIPLDRHHIIGHNQVPGCPYSGGGADCHTDPGTGWDWNHFMALVQDPNSASTSASAASNGSATNTGSQSTGQLVGFIREGSVTNSSGGIAGAMVSLSNGLSTKTDSRGFYHFSEVSTGATQIQVKISGFVGETHSKTVQAGMENWKSIALDRSGGGSSSSGSSGSGSSPSSATTVPGVPVDLSPIDQELRNGPHVTMSWSGQGGSAQSYDVEIWYWTGAKWLPYYVYLTTGQSKTFYPIVDRTTYAFKVRGRNGAGVGVWSDWGSFNFLK
jgi:N-acetyl-anhydromuramyl-L-alanine amidase AmpD